MGKSLYMTEGSHEMHLLQVVHKVLCSNRKLFWLLSIAEPLKFAEVQSVHLKAQPEVLTKVAVVLCGSQ